MASTGDDGSEAESIDRRLGESSVDAGAENDDAFDLEEAQGDPLNIRHAQPAHGSDQESQNEDSEDGERENRFQGPSSTWRFFTEEERSLAASLDQQRANDLSLHLYNAHALKARSRDSAAANVENYHSKKKWLKPDAKGGVPWQPPASWTAWPLHPECVPRSGEKFGVPVVPDDLEGETYRKPERWKPSGHLQEEILAIAMRKAKERLGATSEQDGHAAHAKPLDSPPHQHFEMLGALPADADVSMADESDTSTDTVTVKDHAKRAVMAPTTVDESVLIDDDEARTMLQPKINHVLSRLDGLLLALQKSRSGQVRTNSRSQSRSGRSRSTSRPAKTSTRSKSRESRNLRDSEESLSSDEGAADGVESNDYQPKRQRKLNPRDWSEVLGMAAFTGWDPKVLDRASKRCAALFGESMDFRTVLLNSVEETKTRSQAAGVHNENGADAMAEESLKVEDKPPTNPYVCPVESCARHAAPFGKAWRWREHLKRSHKFSNAKVQKLEATLVDDTKKAKTSAKAPGHVEKARGALPTTDPVLRPVKVKMQRGKDKQPRKKKASQLIQIDSDGSTPQQQPIQIDTDTGSDEDMERHE